MVQNEIIEEINLKMGNILSFPQMDKIKQMIKTSEFEAVGKEMQGYRVNMEDEMIISELNIENHYIFAIFDGHGGSSVSEYLRINFIRVFVNNENWDLYNESEDVFFIKKALNETCLEIDKDILNDVDLFSNECGSTGIICVMTPTHIICANVGDSRSIILTETKICKLSDDHKPNNEFEKGRIESAGGYVRNNRVCGNLALSRAFGDGNYKKGGENDKTHRIIAHPDIEIYVRSKEDKYLILACDGIWDVFTNENLNDAINTFERLYNSNDGYPTVKVINSQNSAVFLHEFSHNYENTLLDVMSDYILDYAVAKGSKDNCSIIFLKFN